MAKSQTVVDVLYEENRALCTYLVEQKQISFQSQADERFCKVLILASASYFEQKIVEIVVSASSVAAPSAPHIVEFIKKKALSRQFHTLFDWDSKNANKFFAFFGDDLKASVAARVQKDAELRSGIEAFVELGSLRNSLVHQNFASFVLEKTADEVYRLYQKAFHFVGQLASILTIAHADQAALQKSETREAE